MTSLNVAKFVSAINVITLCIAAFLALCGALAVLGKYTRLNFFRNALFLPALGIAALVAFAAEATAFNFSPYLRFFSGGSFRTTHVSPDNPSILQTTDGTLAEIVQSYDGSVGLRFSGLNRKVTSVYVKSEFQNTEIAQLTIQRQDQEGLRAFRKIIYKNFPYENHTPVYAQGNVEEMTLFFSATGDGASVNITEVAINEPIPFFFSGLRILAVSLIVFAIIVLFNKKLRAKASYGLFEYKFDPMNKRQNFAYAATVAAVILYSLIIIHTSLPNGFPKEAAPNSQYALLADAFIAGRTWLEGGQPEKMVGAEPQIYDRTWRARHADIYPQDVVWMSDWVYYKGKMYTYYPFVPVVLLYVPYKLATGSSMPDPVGAWFYSIYFILLAALWRYCVKKYMPKLPFAFYLLGFLTLFGGGCLEYLLRGPGFLSASRALVMCFTMGGILLLIKSAENEKTKLLPLFFACLCLALAVGCRPSFFVVSVAVPIILWKRRSWKLAMFILAPYIMVAVPMCMYNYVRFGSVFEFGQSYLTTMGNPQGGSVNILGWITTKYIVATQYLFRINKYSIQFPFVEALQPGRWIREPNIFVLDHAVSGMINYPIVFCLFYLFKNIFNKDPSQNVLSAGTSSLIPLPRALFAVGAAMAALIWARHIDCQYPVDYMAFVVIMSLFSAYYWSNCPKSEMSRKLRLKTIYVLCAVTIFVGMCLTVLGENSAIGRYFHNDPVLYRYLEKSLGLVKT